jgi:NAD-dependent deacetylase
VAPARRLVVLTGAGVSRESGIDTFRDDDDGLWRRFPPELFATPAGIEEVANEDPARLIAFLRALVEPIARAAPNAAHRAIGGLEDRVRALGGVCDVVTQNIDGLHQEAGSGRVHEVHGSLLRMVPLDGGTARTVRRAELRACMELRDDDSAPVDLTAWLARVNGLLQLPVGVVHRPSIVLFGEAMAEPAWRLAREAVAAADALVVIGTSGTVYPVAGLAEDAAARGVPVVGVGPERRDATVWLTGNAGDVVPALLEQVRAIRASS